MPKILLVEDNEMNRDLISRRLKRRGFEIVLAHDGAEGIEKASSERPDLILMDMGLPIIDGYEATRILKGDAASRAIPIIGLSAHAMSGDADRALEAGCDDYDTKPVEWPRLLGKIQTQLDRASETTILSGADLAAQQGSDQDSGSLSPHWLLVDDNAVHCEVLAGHLANLGQTYEVAQSSSEALDLLRGKTFDGVLLDVTLPPAEGRPLLQHLRDDGPWKDLAVLMLCPIDAVAEAVACLDQGADDILAQPFPLPLLKARIESSLARHRGVRQAQDSEALAEAKRSNRYLLGSLLPDPLVRELEERRRIPPRTADAVVLAVDVLGFARLCDGGDPVATVATLHQLVSTFEAVAAKHGVEKVRTAGDSFLAAAGLFGGHPNAALSAVLCALEMREEARRLAQGWSVRFGLHRGPVTLGVIGRRRYQFDLWGGTVEIAELVRSHGALGAVNVSVDLWQAIQGRAVGEPLPATALADGRNLSIVRVDRISG